MKKTISALLLLISLGITAQECQLFVASAEKSIQLKWMSKSLVENSTFDVYRKESSGNWQKINDKVITASPIITVAELKTNKNTFPNDQKYATYIDYKNSKETNENKQAYANYSLVIAAVFDNDLAKHLGIYFEDKNVSLGKKYQYKVVNALSQKELSVSMMIQLGDKPLAPVDLKAVQEKQNVTLSWKAQEEFIGYNVYKNGTKLNEEVILPNAEKDQAYTVNLVDENVTPGTQKYTVSGITFLNTESQISTATAIDVKDLTPPSGITSLKGIRKENEIVLEWKGSKDKKAKGYFVYKSSDKGKTFKKLNTAMLEIKTENFIDKKTDANFGSFQYQIETIDALGNATKSMPVSVFIPDHLAPAEPKSFVGKTESGKISLSWQSNTEKDLIGYRIYRGLKDNDENSMLLLNVKPQMATTFIDTFPKKASTKFIYKLTAIDQSFNESKKATLWVQLPDLIPPAAPFFKSATLKDNAVALQWELVRTDAILGYNIYRTNGEKSTKVNTNYITTDNFSDNTLLKKGMYEYYIQAIDSAQLESKPSNRIVINTSASLSNAQIKLKISQELSSKKVVLEVEGIKEEEIQTLRLYRKDGRSGFKAIPAQFVNGIFIDTSSESGKLYDYYADIVNQNDERIKTEVTHFNNP
jgi:fibronectin type 3 domain-containing protein